MRDALLLAARQLVAALADDRVVALRAAPSTRSWIAAARAGGLELARRSPRAWRTAGSSRTVAWNRYVSWVTTPMTSPRMARREPAHVDAVDLDRAGVDVVQPRHEVGRRGLAGARRPDERDELPGSASKSMSSQARTGAIRSRERAGLPPSAAASASASLGRPTASAPAASGRVGAASRRRPATTAPRRVAEADVAEADAGPRTAARSRATASGASTISGSSLEVLEDAVEQRERALDLDLDVEQLAEREEQPRLERRERDDVADRRRGRVALDRQVAGEPVHERRRDARRSCR